MTDQPAFPAPVDACPLCSADLRAEPIPDRPGEHYSRVIGVEIQGVRDGVLFWACPDCHGTINRWDPERDHRLYAKADEHGRRYSEAMRAPAAGRPS